MYSDENIKDGFKPRAPIGPRKKRENNVKGSIWIRDSALRYAKYAAQRTMEDLLGPQRDKAIRERTFKKCGASPTRISRLLVERNPWVPLRYEELRGVPYTHKILGHRSHKSCVYENGKPGYSGTAGLSREHYSKSPAMRPYLDAMEALYMKSKQKPTTYEEAKAAGSGEHNEH
jgi:hypothetical protein